ncbi:HAMP domain-containing histidine kinase [bacterium]|nr:HAMP domain-containing histidine kinase [candidate division CSSED10-310 bacterium]
MIDLDRVRRQDYCACLESNLTRVNALHKLYKHYLTAAKERLGADATCLLHGRLGQDHLSSLLVVGDGRSFNQEILALFAGNQAPHLPDNLLLSAVRVHGRLVGVTGAARNRGAFSPRTGYALNEMAEVLALVLTRRVESRLQSVLARIKEKIVRELRPIDLAYQILAGILQLVGPDHSAAFLAYDDRTGELRVEAEKVVWTKTKSGYIGYSFAAPAALAAKLIESPHSRILDDEAVLDPVDRQLYDILRYWHGKGVPAPSSILCTPLLFGTTLLGLLKIAAWRRTPFDRWDVTVVDDFRQVAATALRNARVAGSLEDRVLQAEFQAGQVTLAQAVSHDIRNAAGAILLLAPQMRVDLQDGECDPGTLVEDLDQIIHKAALIKRIFNNLLRETGTGRTGVGPVDLNQVIRETMAFFSGDMERKGIRLLLRLNDAIPVVRASHRHLEHIIGGLVNNAVDAFSGNGGEIGITTTLHGNDRVILEIRDNGPGMTAEQLAAAQEPFYTTKPGGTGLGLPICRTLTWQMNGRLSLVSALNIGTTATVEMEANR